MSWLELRSVQYFGFFRFCKEIHLITFFLRNLTLGLDLQPFGI